MRHIKLVTLQSLIVRQLLKLCLFGSALIVLMFLIAG